MRSSVVPLHHFKGKSIVLGQSLPPEQEVEGPPQKPTVQRCLQASLWQLLPAISSPHTAGNSQPQQQLCCVPWTAALLHSHLQLWLQMAQLEQAWAKACRTTVSRTREPRTAVPWHAGFLQCLAFFI